jgi:hypothetical protein
MPYPHAFPRKLNDRTTPPATVKVVSHTNVCAVGGKPPP